MNLLDTVEQKVLFRVIRVATFLAVVVMSFGAGYGIKTLVENHSSAYVSLKDVREALDPPKTTSEESQPGESEQRLSDAKLIALGIHTPTLMQFSDDSNREVLTGWLDLLDSPKAKRDFIGNLNDVVAQAPAEAVTDYINKYKELKLGKLRSNQFGEYADAAKLGATVLFVMLTLALVGLFSLVLVLLAIERNTRKAAPALQTVAVESSEPALAP